MTPAAPDMKAQGILVKESAPLPGDYQIENSARILHCRHTRSPDPLPSNTPYQRRSRHMLTATARLLTDSPPAAVAEPELHSLPRLAAAPRSNYLPCNCCWGGGARAGSAADPRRLRKCGLSCCSLRSMESNDGPW